MSSFHTTMTTMFLERLLASPTGRAHMLNQIADAEDNGEAQVFDQALAFVEDEKLAKMIRIHRDDEIRHAEMFRECRDRTGVNPGDVPDEIKVLDRIDRAMGNFFAQPITDDEGVMRAYLILQVIEERAVQQFTLVEPIMRRYDAKTADVFVQVAKDEERHLKYCRAISRRYAPSPDVLQSELQRIRTIEATAFLENNAYVMRHLLDVGAMPGVFNRVFWPAVTWFGRTMGAMPYTDFAKQTSSSAPSVPSTAAA